MVRVCLAAALLIREEVLSDGEARRSMAGDGQANVPASAAPHLGIAQATAGNLYSGVSAQRLAATTKAVLNAVSFPRFVTDLINGVFKAMVDSSIQQMQSYAELLNNVAASTEGFAGANMGPDRARAWLVERYPVNFEIVEDAADDDGTSRGSRVQLKGGASLPPAEALKTDLGLADGESVSGGDPERTLVPLVRRRLAKTRQEVLATMVMLGIQRIVVESGRITAALRFHIDTRSVAQSDEGSSTSIGQHISGSGSFGIGAWGVSASAQTNIGYVSTQREQTTEEMNTDLELNSSVEINFKSDYLPLNRLASPGQVDRSRQNSRNPEEEARAAEEKRRATTAAADKDRRDTTSKALVPPAPMTPRPGEKGSPEDAERARKEAASRK